MSFRSGPIASRISAARRVVVEVAPDLHLHVGETVLECARRAALTCASS
jgi:hypothetical protein